MRVEEQISHSPTDVVLSCGQDKPEARARPVEVFVAPVGGKITRNPRMIDLESKMIR